MENDSEGWVSWGHYEFAHAENIEISNPETFEGFVFSGAISNGRYIVCPLKFTKGEPDPRDVNPICAELGWKPSLITDIFVGTSMNSRFCLLTIRKSMNAVFITGLGRLFVQNLKPFYNR